MNPKPGRPKHRIQAPVFKIYLPDDLKEAAIKCAEREAIGIDNLVIDAITAYVEKRTPEKQRQDRVAA